MVAKRRLLALLGIVVLVLAACGPAATATPMPATATPRPTPTATPVPPTPTLLPPGVTPQPTPTPKPTPTPTKPPQVTAKYGGTLTVVRRREDPAWDFMRYTGGGGNLRPMAHMVFSRLYSYVSANPEPCQRGLYPLLGESWKWLNDTTMEVKIRQGVKFHNKPPVNGREVTAEDVAYSFRRGLFDHPVRGIKVLADSVKDVVATGPYTVEFRTKTPLGLLPEALSWSYSLVTLAKESGGPEDSWENPAKSWIGSGPFMFEQWMPGLKVTMTRNPDYFEKGFPYVDKVVNLVMPDKPTVEAGMRSGKLDLWNWDVGQLSVEAIKKSTPNIQVQDCPEAVGRGPGWVYLKWDAPLWQDIRVRRAAMLAVDRQAIIKTALLGRGVEMAPWPPVLPVLTKRKDLSPEAQKLLDYNPEEARRLLREAGYTKDNPPEMNVITTTRYGLTGPVPTSMEALESMWTDVGFKVKLDWQESGRYMAGFIVGKWPEGFNTGVGLWSAWNSFSLTKFHCKASAADNKAGVCDPDYDALVNKWLSTLDPDKSWELAKAIQSMIIERVYGIPGAVGYEFAVWQPWVKNYTYAQYQYPRPITYTWLDK